MTEDVDASSERTEFLDDFATRWLQAWNSHDTGQVLSLMHPDISWDDQTFWTDVIHGTDELRTYVDRIWRTMPDVHFDEIGRFFDPRDLRGVVLFRQTGSAPPQLRTDRGFDSHGCDIFLRFQDGLLASYLASYDITGMLIQMGALPPKNGRIGGSYHLSLMNEGRTDA